MEPSRRAIAQGFAMALVACCTGNAAGQAYPHKPIRLIVGHAAGGANDIVARIIATRLSENIGQQVIVDNRPGAAGIIGTTLLAESAPDGYTMMLANVPHGANPALRSKLPYDWQGVVVRAGTPRDIVVKLNTEINRVLSSPDVKERIADLGAEVIGSTPEHLTDFIKAEINRWRKVITPDMRIDYY